MQENQNPVRPVKDVIPLSAHSQLLDQLREVPLRQLPVEPLAATSRETERE